MSVDQIDDSSAPLIEHLAELRNRILYSMAAFMACFVIGYLIWKPIFGFLSHPMCTALAERGQQCQLILVKMQEGFFVAIKIAMWGGFAMAFPIIAYQLWRFVAPGLYRNEKNAFLPFLVASPVMFLIGAAFAYFVILPFAFSFFLTFQDGMLSDPLTAAVTGSEADPENLAGVSFQGSMEAYLSLTMSFVMAFGLCFQLPVLLTLLGRAGIISSDGLAGVRKYAVVAILLVAAIVTPPDAVSQIILFCAIYPLYEISILLVRRFEKKREAELRAEGLWVDDDDAGTGKA
jgi:sec-independent protein translocase protein TatC